MNVEKSIRKFDRIFTRVEAFQGRKFLDPENHERREKRMLSAKRDRWTNNYTYFFGGLTEEEQMFRDYYKTELENNPQDDKMEEKLDEMEMAFSGEFHIGTGENKRFDFVETGLAFTPHENFEDLIEDKLFKYRYRMYHDEPETYLRREKRRVERFLQRAENRDPEVERDLH